MDTIYDYLDYKLCFKVASKYLENSIKSNGAASNLGSFKIHIEKIHIKRQQEAKEVSFKIELTPFFIRDILRFSIKEFNNLIYCFYSLKTPFSILEKITRDISIDYDKIPLDPLVFEKSETSLSSQFFENLNSTIDDTNSIIIFKIKKNLSDIKELFKNLSIPQKDGISLIIKKMEKLKKIIKDYDLLKENFIALDELKNLLILYDQERTKALDLIAELEAHATNTNEKLDYKTILKRHKKTIYEIGEQYQKLYSIFIQSREAKKIVLQDWLSLSMPKWPFSIQLFKSLIKKFNSNPSSMKKISNFLDSYYVSILSQTSFISSPRRHLLRAIVSSLKANRDVNYEYFSYIDEFEKSAKNFEKQASLLLFGFSEKDPVKKFQTLKQFLDAYKRVFDDATSLLTILSINKKQNVLVAAPQIKAIVFYLQYISLRRFVIEKNALNLLFNLLDEKQKKYYSKKIEEFLKSYEQIYNKSKEFIKKIGFDTNKAANDEFKLQRTKTANDLKNTINKLEKILPIHYQRAKDRYAIYESHTNYKFGPWYDNVSSEQIFSAEMLLITAFHMLKKAAGEKQSIKEKKGSLFYQTPEQKKLLAKRIKEFQKTHFFNLSLTKLSDLIDRVDSSYNKLVELNKQIIQRIQDLLTINTHSKNLKNWNDFIFPHDAKLFYHYERDIQDQLHDKFRSIQGFSNKQLNGTIYVELNKKRRFQPTINLELEGYSFKLKFNAKDPSKLSITPSHHSALGKSVLPVQAFNPEEVQRAKFFKDLEFLSSLEDTHYNLDNVNYYLHKAFCPAIKNNKENQDLLYGILSDANSNEKGLVVFNKELNKYVLYLPPKLSNKKGNVVYVDASIDLSKIKDSDLFEKQRLAILQIKRANTFFERKDLLLLKTLKYTRFNLI